MSEAREEGTFLANDAAYPALPGAVTQLRRSETVTPGVGLTVCGGVWCFKEKRWVPAELSPCILKARSSASFIIQHCRTSTITGILH